MSSPLSQSLGATRRRTLTATSKGAVFTKFTDADPLTAEVWTGGDQAVLFRPSVVWHPDGAATGKAVMTITAQQLAAAGVKAGEYHLLVRAYPVSDGQPRELYDGRIAFNAIPGYADAPFAWVTFDDMAVWSPGIVSLQSEGDDLTGFARQRAQATSEAVKFLVDRYNPVLGQSMRYVNADGTGFGPYPRLAPPGDGRAAPTREQVRTWLTQPGRVVVDGDLLEAVSLIATGLVYGVNSGSSNPYAQHARADESAGRKTLRETLVEVDTKATVDGVATVRIGRNVTYLS